MKKKIAIVLGLALMTTSAWATKARMDALGQDDGRGSHYISDTRNVFRNAAHVNHAKNYVVTEWGTAASETAEGGFFREMGAFSYGVYLGSELGSTESEAQGGTISLGGQSFTSTTGSANFTNRSNDLHLFFGGDMGVEWGARLNYSKNTNKVATAGIAEEKTSSLGLGFGIVMGDLEASVNLDLSEKFEGDNSSTATDGNKWEADTGMNVNVAYGFGSWTAFVEYDKRGGEYTAEATPSAKDEYSSTEMVVGVGHTKEVSSSARIYTDIEYKSSKKTLKIGTSSEGEIKYSRIPLTVGFEADANSWLTLRGSISQNLPVAGKVERKDAGATTKSEQTVQATTDVAAGATLNFGKLKVDGMIGTSNTTRSSTTTESGILALDNLLTQVAVHYWF